MISKMKLWLDDTRPAPEGWMHVASVADAILWCKIIGLSEVEEISLDHDLGENVATGYDFMKWLENESTKDEFVLPIIHIHSANPVGRVNMQRAIDSINRMRQRALDLDIET